MILVINMAWPRIASHARVLFGVRFPNKIESMGVEHTRASTHDILKQNQKSNVEQTFRFDVNV